MLQRKAININTQKHKWIARDSRNLIWSVAGGSNAVVVTYQLPNIPEATVIVILKFKSKFVSNHLYGYAREIIH
jgi:hypothetical protein